MKEKETSSGNAGGYKRGDGSASDPSGQLASPVNNGQEVAPAMAPAVM